jgi:hypothetical protein
LKTTKQEVIIGHTNANDVVILGGLGLADKVYLSIPQGMEEDEISLLKEMNGKRKKEEQEQQKPAETEQKKIVPTASTQR